MFIFVVTTLWGIAAQGVKPTRPRFRNPPPSLVSSLPCLLWPIQARPLGPRVSLCPLHHLHQTQTAISRGLRNHLFVCTFTTAPFSGPTSTLSVALTDFESSLSLAPVVLTVRSPPQQQGAVPLHRLGTHAPSPSLRSSLSARRWFCSSGTPAITYIYIHANNPRIAADRQADSCAGARRQPHSQLCIVP